MLSRVTPDPCRSRTMLIRVDLRPCRLESAGADIDLSRSGPLSNRVGPCPCRSESAQAIGTSPFIALYGRPPPSTLDCDIPHALEPPWPSSSTNTLSSYTNWRSISSARANACRTMLIAIALMCPSTSVMSVGPPPTVPKAICGMPCFT